VNPLSKKKSLVGSIIIIVGIVIGAFMLISIKTDEDNGLDTSPPLQFNESNIKSLNIFAHMDDDLGGMNPDIYYDIQQAGTTGTVISNWFTGNTSGSDEAIEGGKVVYAFMADMPNSWSTETININNKDIKLQRLDGTNIYLINMMFPDGSPDGGNPTTVEKLWKNEITTISTLDDGVEYTRDDVIQYIADLISYFSIDTVRHLYHLGEFGDDKEHSDHHAMGKFAHKGVKLTPKELSTVIAYRADSQGEDGWVKLTDEDEAINSEILDVYAPHGDEYLLNWRNMPEIVEDMGRIWRYSYIPEENK